jgi:hypothetical protein
MKKYLNEAHFGLLVGLCAFIYFLYTGLTKEKITSGNNLTEIKGIYQRHSFKDNSGFKNFTNQYYIWTANYKNAFQIKANYLRLFNADEFATNIKVGDSITFTIPKTLIDKLNSEGNVFVTSIETKGTTYIDKNKVLEYEKHWADKNTDYFFAFAFLIVGLVVYFKRRKNYW